jgi:hypothetical protein
VTGIHFRIGEGDIAGVVSPDERKRHRDGALGQYTAFG